MWSVYMTLLPSSIIVEIANSHCIVFIFKEKLDSEFNFVPLQMSGHSGMISFYLKGGLEESEKFLKALKVSQDLDNST